MRGEKFCFPDPLPDISTVGEGGGRGGVDSKTLISRQEMEGGMSLPLPAYQ